MRNPWGSERWNGPWCDSCNEWKAVSKTIKDSIGYAKDDGIFFMPIENYKLAFAETHIGYDVSSGWFEGHYLFLNDLDRKNGKSEHCGAHCTRHEFKLKNTATVKQKVYAYAHMWEDRIYPDKKCKREWSVFWLDVPGFDLEW